MKILICYDGSECADAALENLSQAGLPVDTEATVLTLTENWTLVLEEQQKDLQENANAFDTIDDSNSETLKRIHEDALAAFAEAEKFAQTASERVQGAFPHWQVRHEAIADFRTSGIIKKAAELRADLIITGSHGRGAAGRFILGSTSLKVLTGAECSVRIARKSPGRSSDDDSPVRLIIGVDGSHDSSLAVEAVARRVWRQESSVRLVNTVEPLLSPWLGNEIQQAEEICRLAAQKLADTGFHVSTTVQVGEAKQILIKEAEKWGADAIFIGARGHHLLERILLGSVSYAVAARAHCSVEIVRGEQIEN